MHERPTERVRALLDGLTAHAIVERVHPYYQGYQFEGEWLDALKGAIADELDEVDAKVRPYERYTCHDVCADVAELSAENAELRELVRVFYHCTTSGVCDECPVNGGGAVHLMPDTICDTIHDRMRELGVSDHDGRP